MMLTLEAGAVLPRMTREKADPFTVALWRMTHPEFYRESPR